jgi:limonene-1,2-epoxide hydrolase
VAPVRLSLLVVVLAVSACGGGDPSPESVVRAWSEAINSDDSAGAARLFADGARVVQDDEVRRLETYAEARAWNASLPCAGRIVRLTAHGETVRVTFVLGRRRPQTPCDGPGERAQALFRVREGRIVLWHQLDPALEPDEEPV